ncbi:hypothetical protein GCM10010404_00860 [Nonomuraea africana]
MRAPEPLAVVERDDGDVALYLEDAGGERLTVEGHAVMARRLGRAQGGATVPAAGLPALDRLVRQTGRGGAPLSRAGAGDDVPRRMGRRDAPSGRHSYILMS